MSQWSVYIIRCADDTLYTGITDDLEKRLVMHADGKGAKYTRGRGPYKVLYIECCATRSDALKRELYIKSLKRSEKLQLVKSAL
jgi:putative endonuclease